MTPCANLLKTDIEAAGRSTWSVAKAARINVSRLSEVLSGKRRLSPATAVAVGRVLGLDPRRWLHVLVEEDLAAVQAAEVRAAVVGECTLG